MHEVAVLVPHAVVTFDLAIPCQVLAYATLDEDHVRYRVTTCRVRPGPVQTSNGFSLQCQEGPRYAEAADTVVAPGTADMGTVADDDVSRVLHRAATRGARIVSICTGASALAAAGLLDGRRATTHWSQAARLAETYPEIDVDPMLCTCRTGPCSRRLGSPRASISACTSYASITARKSRTWRRAGWSWRRTDRGARPSSSNGPSRAAPGRVSTTRARGCSITWSAR